MEQLCFPGLCQFSIPVGEREVPVTGGGRQSSSRSTQIPGRHRNDQRYGKFHWLLYMTLNYWSGAIYCRESDSVWGEGGGGQRWRWGRGSRSRDKLWRKTWVLFQVFFSVPVLQRSSPPVLNYWLFRVSEENETQCQSSKLHAGLVALRRPWQEFHMPQWESQRDQLNLKPGWVEQRREVEKNKVSWT